ncbi:MAG: DNA polymerase III subunit delta [Christensenellaceae bacterium]|jgi:DNA polymerase-3 subunit delta|nr:DNA polymerase III subunit delta [Christensenellaceae bacterium]
MEHIAFFNAVRQGSLSGAYLLHGEEEYVKDSALAALAESLDEAARELNVQYLSTAEADTLIAACETLPFFAERRLVVCRALPVEADAQRIVPYLPRLPQSTLLIFAVRGRAKETLALVKALKQANHIVDFAPLTALDAAKWVSQKAVKLGVTITQEAAKHIVALVGRDVGALNNEFTKAACYAGIGNEVTREAISASVTRNIELRVFDMVDSFLAGQAKDGLHAYKRMLDDGESPFRMAALLEGNFKRMLAARAHIDAGTPRDKALAHLGNTYPMRRSYDQAQHYSRAQLLENIARFANVGYLQVSGQQKDADALESALIRCMPKRG